MVDHVAEMANGTLDLYTGNYSAYLKASATRRVRACSRPMKAKQDREIAHLEAFVEKFRYKATKAKQAQDRVTEARADQENRIVHSRGEEDTCTSTFPQPRAHRR